MSDRPPLELLTAGASPRGYADLVLSLSRWCRPMAGAPWHHDSPPAATLASSSRAAGLDAAFDAGRPVALWVSGDEPDSERSRLEAAAVLLSDDPGRLDCALLDRLVHVPVPGIDLTAWPATMPHVRRRRRRSNGRPDPMIFDATLDTHGRDGVELAAELALASAAVVDMRWVTASLALATPTVTQPLTAASLGALDGIHVVVADPADQLDAARELAEDEHRSARIARAGRQLVEQLHDRGKAAAEVAQALGILPRLAGPRALLAERIRELQVPGP